MQTFLPLPTFKASAQVLDRQRLGKQRIECYQILSTLLGKSAGWANHPAVKMWKRYEFALVEYTFTVCAEWTLRGYKDSVGTKVVTELLADVPDSSHGGWPPHFDEAFRRSHQSNLLRKDPAHYGPYFPDVPADLPYVWPMPDAK
jgi:hypothetical protein